MSNDSISRAARLREWSDVWVVFAVLATWWLVGPVLFDDGWVAATLENYKSDRQFASYYETFNEVFPVGYLHDSLLRGFHAVSSSLLWLRIPSLGAGLVTWLLIRSMSVAALRRLGREPIRGALLVAAGVFLLYWISWNSTLRPEPFVATLASVVLWSAMQFVARPAVSYLLLGGLAATAAASMHPAGFVVIAAAVPMLPTLAVWVRTEGRNSVPALAAAVINGVASLVLLLWAQSDAAAWNAARETFAAESAHNLGWRDELTRYSLLLGAGNAVRRASVFLPALAPALYAFRLRRTRDAVADLPVIAFAVAVLLLAFTPSKWIWHFGVLAPFAATALAVEWQRWRHAGDGTTRLVRSGVLAAAVVLLNAIAWAGDFVWNPLDVVALDTSSFLGVDPSHPALWSAVAISGLAISLAVDRFRRGGWAPRVSTMRWAGSVGGWLIAVSLLFGVATPVAAFTVDGLVLADGWSLAKQNLDTLRGATCGIADEVAIVTGEKAAAREARRLRTVPIDDIATGPELAFAADGVYRRSAGALLDVKLRTFGSWLSGDEDQGHFVTPWYAIGDDAPPREKLTIWTAGRPTTGGNSLTVQLGTVDGDRVRDVAAIPLELPQNYFEWQQWNVGGLIADHGDADVLRLIAVDGSSQPGGWLAFSEPSFPTLGATLQRYAEERGGTVLVAPLIRMYFPCFQQPPIRDGVAALPTVIVSFNGWPHSLGSSPHRYVDDLAVLTPVPVEWAAASRLDLPFEVLEVTP